MLPSPSAADFIDMRQQVRGIVVDPKSSGLMKFIGTIAATENADPQSAASCRRQHVPDAVADDHGGFDRRVEPRGRCEKKVGVRSGSTPSLARFTAAVSIRPLVAIAQGMPASVSQSNNSRAPGSGRMSF